MANGLFGSLVLPDATANLVATVTSKCFFAEVDISVINPTGADITVNIAISSAAASTPNPDDFIEKGGVAPASGGGISHSSIKVSPGSKIFVQGSALGLVAQVRGKAITKRGR